MINEKLRNGKRETSAGCKLEAPHLDAWDRRNEKLINEKRETSADGGVSNPTPGTWAVGDEMLGKSGVVRGGIGRGCPPSPPPPGIISC